MGLLENLKKYIFAEEDGLKRDRQRLTETKSDAGILYLKGKTDHSAGSLAYLRLIVESEENRLLRESEFSESLGRRERVEE